MGGWFLLGVSYEVAVKIVLIGIAGAVSKKVQFHGLWSQFIVHYCLKFCTSSLSGPFLGLVSVLMT
jgi:hypothetical protein